VTEKLIPLEIYKYLPYLDEFSISHTEKVEFIEALYLFAQRFIDMDDMERAT
jgi:hypothetical protein